ncbi:MAG: COX15/CtaA family protein [Gammaproteobacteria bacterium]|uniref:COX15/CtaA family protein n=1 Tax=Azohydromonas sp. TaxID=1872666 RepID=UPI002C279017|nr:COX15/CtaA family protein [Azohydromonas sp.]HMM85419.1 COX15/CtaA family protein [Azohydromonas sp.]
METQSLVDLAPLARLALLGIVVAAGPLAWIWLRHRGASPARRLHALTLLTAFLTFDLIVFGAFTRLTDSGLGCPDWPGCYGKASPIGARAEIHAAQTEMPTGPVTHGKAWIEMVHRYLATGVGVLITVMAIVAWTERRRGTPGLPSPWWPTATLAWVSVQGAFGAWTVTLKLYPAIVTAHLLGGLALLALLVIQAQRFAPKPLALSPVQHAALWVLAGLSVLQIALGGWVSTNYAVLACTDFPTCQGRWWPEMDFANAFVLRRELGAAADGSYLPFAALTAIHYTHRLFAYLVLAAMLVVAAMLRRAHRSGAWALVALAAWQLLSGLTNIVLEWPIVAALAHSAGAALLVGLLTLLLTRAALARSTVPAGAIAARAWSQG